MNLPDFMAKIGPELFDGDDAPAKVDALIVRVRQTYDYDTAIAAPDMENPEDRRHLASRANAVARCKTRIDGIGKDLVADWKARAGRVDALRRTARTELDALKARVRAPLTQYEEAEAARAREAEEAERREREARFIALREQAAEAERKAADERKRRADAEKRIADLERQAERDRLAREAAEREQAAAAERAEELRKASAERERQEQERAAARERAEAERLEQARRDERQRLEREAAEAAERERAEAEAAKHAEALAEQVHAGIISAFAAHGINNGAELLELIKAGEIPGVYIAYEAPVMDDLPGGKYAGPGGG